MKLKTLYLILSFQLSYVKSSLIKSALDTKQACYMEQGFTSS